MNFDQAFEVLLKHEGGYAADHRDPGGETKFGISKRSYPGEDIAGMTIERAKQIYLRDYWGPAGCDAVPDALKLQLFDTTVHSGVTMAIKTLQRAAYADADGILGPHTLMAVQSMPASRLIARFNGFRLEFLTGLPTWAEFGRGFAKRIAANLKEA